ncbi:MAG: 23S rRNA (uracil(1939)-C(5))-methyltransferase RlmD, partial [Flavobacteriales bacterium]|nr:23S rRNA (uracil(1939)-C(5))-methyltransferase RlmD [Flavobacteriales bacterium]
RQFCENSGLPAWHPPKKEGFFRYLVVRKSYLTNQFLIKLVTSSTGMENFKFDEFISLINNLFGDRVAGLLHTINDDIGDNAQSRLGYETILFGENTIKEKLLGMTFEISMQSFFQTNPKCAELLYQKTIDYVFEDNNIDDTVIMDLFCGTGTIGQLIASKTNSKVIGVDIVEDAIKNAKGNAKTNNIDNIEFFAADVNKFLIEYPEYQNKIGTIVLDPPRAGISKKALKKVVELNANRIVYVSCNPSTQARDMEILFEAGYQLKKMSLVDQFPHTSHIEAIALFTK